MPHTDHVLQTVALDVNTWPAFAALVERNNGVWGGCWCMGFHPEGVGKDTTASLNRERKEQRVRAGSTHSALVMDDGDCVGWCQFGSPAELPRIKSRRAYDEGAAAAPDWRITCFFTDSRHRHRGIASHALGGALELIGRQGGGVVEAYPEDVTGRKVSSSFLHGGTLGLFEQHGFRRVRPIAKHRWVVSRMVF
jgi:GNAT superfamily N-acetyltransferase